jgi:hypothetical protein
MRILSLIDEMHIQGVFEPLSIRRNCAIVRDWRSEDQKTRRGLVNIIFSSLKRLSLEFSSVLRNIVLNTKRRLL